MSKDNTFIIRVMDAENGTWHGTITWTNESRQEVFRSALELLKLIDSAVTDEAGTQERGSA